MRAALLEYGTSKAGRKGHTVVPARPWRSAAVGATEGTVVRQVEETLKSVLDLD